jgi:hypothetical protein
VSVVPRSRAILQNEYFRLMTTPRYRYGGDMPWSRYVRRGFSRGFSPTDWGQPNNPLWAARDYNAAVATGFTYNRDTIAQAQTEAAARGVPIVLVYGSASTRGTQRYLQRTLQDIKRSVGEKAVLVYIDTSQYEDNTPIGKWRDAGHNRSVYTRVQTVVPNREGKPTWGTVIGGSWGVGPDVVKSTASRVESGILSMRRDVRRFKDLPDYRLEPITFDRLQQASEAFKRHTLAAHNKERRGQFAAAVPDYSAAIRAADRFTIGQLLEEKRKIEAERAKEMRKAEDRDREAKLRALAERQEMADILIAGKASARYGLGLLYGHSPRTHATGKELILQAGRRDRDIYSREEPVPGSRPPATRKILDKDMRAAGYSVVDVAEVRSKSGLPKYGKLADDLNVIKPLIKPKIEIPRPIPRPDVLPRRDVRPRRPLDVEAQYPFSSDRASGDAKSLVAAVKKATFGGKPVPLVFEVGKKDSLLCQAMETETMSTIRREDQYGKKAVFAYLNLSRAEGQKLASAMVNHLGGRPLAPGTILATVRPFRAGTDDARNPLRVGDYVIVPEKWVPGKLPLDAMKGFLNRELPKASRTMRARWLDVVSTEEPSRDRSSKKYVVFDDIYNPEARRV